MTTFERAVQEEAFPILLSLGMARHHRLGHDSPAKDLNDDVLGIIAKQVISDVRARLINEHARVFLSVIFYKNVLADVSALNAIYGPAPEQVMRWALMGSGLSSCGPIEEVRRRYNRLIASPVRPVRRLEGVPDLDGVVEYLRGLSEDEHAFVDMMKSVRVAPEGYRVVDCGDVWFTRIWRTNNSSEEQKVFLQRLRVKGVY